MMANETEAAAAPFGFMNGARPDTVPSVSERVGGTGLRTPPLAGATFETKRPDQPKPKAQAVLGQ